jgi:hypothetical protein
MQGTTEENWGRRPMARPARINKDQPEKKGRLTEKGESSEHEYQKVLRNVGSVGGAASGLRHSRLG